MHRKGRQIQPNSTRTLRCFFGILTTIRGDRNGRSLDTQFWLQGRTRLRGDHAQGEVHNMGRTFEGRGISPDVVVPWLSEAFAAAADNPLDRAMEVGAGSLKGFASYGSILLNAARKGIFPSAQQFNPFSAYWDRSRKAFDTLRERYEKFKFGDRFIAPPGQCKR